MNQTKTIYFVLFLRHRLWSHDQSRDRNAIIIIIIIISFDQQLSVCLN